jgi:chromosome segregation ATPase
MWKQLVELGNKVFALVRKTEQHETDIKDLREELKGVRQDIKEINQKLDRLAEALQRVSFEHQRDRENAETQRELQRLRLENLMYRFERRLPPGNSQDETQE